jgi:hypothetical protein
VRNSCDTSDKNSSLARVAASVNLPDASLSTIPATICSARVRRARSSLSRSNANDRDCLTLNQTRSRSESHEFPGLVGETFDVQAVVEEYRGNVRAVEKVLHVSFAGAAADAVFRLGC